MKRIVLLAVTIMAFNQAADAQDHGSVTYQGQTIPLSGYRTRISDQKRWVIAEGKKEGKLYSVTITLKPDVTAAGSVKTDATHTATLTISNADYSQAQNYCFDGGSAILVTPQNGRFSVTGKELQSGNCFGKSQGNEKLSFAIKP